MHLHSGIGDHFSILDGHLITIRCNKTHRDFREFIHAFLSDSFPPLTASPST